MEKFSIHTNSWDQSTVNPLEPIMQPQLLVFTCRNSSCSRSESLLKRRILLHNYRKNNENLKLKKIAKMWTSARIFLFCTENCNYGQWRTARFRGAARCSEEPVLISLAGKVTVQLGTVYSLTVRGSEQHRSSPAYSSTQLDSISWITEQWSLNSFISLAMKFGEEFKSHFGNRILLFFKKNKTKQNKKTVKWICVLGRYWFPGWEKAVWETNATGGQSLWCEWLYSVYIMEEP